METTFNISKEVYFNSISSVFPDNVSILTQVKLDFPRMDIFINNKKIKDYHVFLERIGKDYPDYLEKILLLTNQNAHFYSYNKIFNILSKKDFHIISVISEPNEKKFLCTEFTLNALIKQAVIYNKYRVITVDQQDNDKQMYRTLLITTIVDLVILNPILIKIQYID
tara:strand:- start:1682 stop:2182 length:501 start_codon:yes stop_codon:yes gene_type:complete